MLRPGRQQVEVLFEVVKVDRLQQILLPQRPTFHLLPFYHRTMVGEWVDLRNAARRSTATAKKDNDYYPHNHFNPSVGAS